MNLDNFKKRKILVLGDVMLDQYIFGDVHKLSPEAPIPILNQDKNNFVLGGAANVASNIASLNAEVYLAGVIGKDGVSGKFLNLIKEKGIHDLTAKNENRPTSIKKRVMARYPGHPYQQVIRIDRENSEEIGKELEEEVIKKINPIMGKVDCIVFSEYRKGFLTESLISRIKELSKGKIMINNAKPFCIKKFKEMDWIILNTSETEEEIKIKYNGEDEVKIKEMGKLFLEKFGSKYFLMTAGADGMYLYDNEGHSHIKTIAKEVADVSGAGDTVVATLSLALSSGFNPKDSIKIANCAAGIVVGKLGTSTVNLEELKKSLMENGL